MNAARLKDSNRGSRLRRESTVQAEELGPRCDLSYLFDSQAHAPVTVGNQRLGSETSTWSVFLLHLCGKAFETRAMMAGNVGTSSRTLKPNQSLSAAYHSVL